MGTKGPPPTQAEIDACTHIRNIKYPPEQYKTMTAAAKAKKYQLGLAAKEARDAKKRNIAETSTASGAPDSNSNSSNPALFRQTGSPKKPKSESDE